MAVPLHQMAGVMQYVVFSIAAALALFFLVQVRGKRGDWELLFANAALATFYMMQRQWGTAGPATLNAQKSGDPLPWLRYGEWLLTFPSLLVATADLTGLGRRKWGRAMGMLLTFQVALFFGVIAAYCSANTAKIALGSISAVGFGGVLLLTTLTFGVTFKEVPSGLHDFVSLLRFVLLLTWLVYPAIWAIGPEGYHRISYEGEAVAFAFTDLFAKCAWSLLLWYFRRIVWTSVPAHFWEEQEQKPVEELDSSTSGFDRFTKGEGPFLPGKRFQPAAPESLQQATAVPPPKKISVKALPLPKPTAVPSSKRGLFGFAGKRDEVLPVSGWPLGLSQPSSGGTPKGVKAEKNKPKKGPGVWLPGLFDQMRLEQAAYSEGGRSFPVTEKQLPVLNPRPRQEIEADEKVDYLLNPLSILPEKPQFEEEGFEEVSPRERVVRITPEWKRVEAHQSKPPKPQSKPRISEASKPPRHAKKETQTAEKKKARDSNSWKQEKAAPPSAEAKARSSARKMELAIDIPVDTSAESGQKKDADVSNKRSWAAFLFGRKERKPSEPERNLTEPERKSDDVAAKSPGSRDQPTTRMGTVQLPELLPPVTPACVYPLIETPRSILEELDSPLERISEGPESDSSSVARPLMKVPISMTSSGDKSFLQPKGTSAAAIPASITSAGDRTFLRAQPMTSAAATSAAVPKPMTSAGDKTFPRPTPRRRLLPFTDRDEVSSGELQNQETNRGRLPANPPVVDESQASTFAYHASKAADADSDLDSFDSVGSEVVESSSSGIEGEELPQFQLYQNFSRPGSPQMERTRAADADAIQRLSWSLPELGAHNRRSEEPEVISKSRDSPSMPRQAGFDSPQFFARPPITHQLKNTQSLPSDLPPLPPTLTGRHTLSADGSFSDTSSLGLSPLRMTPDHKESTEKAEGGGVSVSFGPPKRKKSGSFSYKASPDRFPQDSGSFVGGTSDQDTSPDASTSNPYSNWSTDMSADEAAQSAWRGEGLGFSRNPADVSGEGLGFSRNPADVSEEFLIGRRLSGEESARSFEAGLVWVKMEDGHVFEARQRSFPASQQSSDALQRLFPANPVGVPLEKQMERDQAESYYETVHEGEVEFDDETEGPQWSNEEPVQFTDRRFRRHPENPVGLIGLGGGLEPIRESRSLSPERRMSPERPRTPPGAVRFYSPTFRRP